MGCGCNKNKSANTGAVKTTASVGSTLWEVVDGPSSTAAIKLRTRSAKAADDLVNDHPGWRKRASGQP